jgi:hypothetical protein
MATIARDTPLAEITLRKYESPESVKGRELVRKFCLSVGLLQPGDSRDVIVDVLHVFLESKKALTSKEVEEHVILNRKKNSLPLNGIASSNIRRQLLRLRDLFLIEKTGTGYHLHEHDSLQTIFGEKIESYYLASILRRVKEYAAAIDKTRDDA